MNNRLYGESDVLIFLGWLSGELPELHAVEVPRIVEAWETYKALPVNRQSDNSGACE